MEAIILQPSRIRAILFLLVCLVFVAVGCWIIIRENSWIGWLNVFFFGVGAVVFIMNLIPGKSYLKLTPEGFEVSSLSRSYTYRWTEVAQFGVADVSFNKMVVFNYSPSYQKAKKGRRISRQLASWEAGLHDTFGMKPQDLADLLNRYIAESKIRVENQPGQI